MSNPMSKSKGWIGVDLDGTLSEYDGIWRGPEAIGAPIPAMVARVKAWLAEGRDVRIFTARVACEFQGLDGAEIAHACRLAIAKWCCEHIGQALPVTCVKDQYCWQIWDDRAVQVITNTGERADGEDEITGDESDHEWDEDACRDFTTNPTAGRDCLGTGYHRCPECTRRERGDSNA